MNEKLIQAIKLETREHPGAPVLLSDLRRRLPGMRKVIFDKAVLELARSGRYFLSKHFHPASSTRAELSLMVPAGDGEFYCAINPREEAVLEPLAPEQEAEESIPEPLKAEPITTRRRGRPPLPKNNIPDGERLTNRRGRPPIPEHLRRIQIRPGYRVPAWVANWMSEQGDIGRVIEKALIGFYKLTPPEP
ncbi:MAG: hypothetical protein HY881_14425 [Deltaproteobacteria bacterium]|nr:hypothetical protein [Deltaproteobacteria bacterium]